MNTKRPNYYTMVGMYTKKPIKPQDIINFVAKEMELTTKNLMMKSRLREHTTARQMIYSILRFDCKMRLAAIGLLFKKDHSTIINGIKKHHDDYFSNPTYRDKYDEIAFLIKLKQHTYESFPNA